MSSLKDLASLIMIPSLYKDGRLDTVKPLGNSIIHPDATGNNDGTDGSTPAEGNFTFSRGSNLAATRVASSGYIEKGRENLLLQSNSFLTSWVRTGYTLTSGQSGYDGSSDAWLAECTSAGQALYQTSNASGVSTFSIYLKQGTANFLRLRADQVADALVVFDLSDGSVHFENNQVIDANVVDLGVGWYRCSMTWNIDTLSNVQVRAEDGNGSPILGTFYIQDAQLESGLVSTSVIETGASTAQAGILEDMPRLDYSGSCPALLLEPQRTNLTPQSEYFDSGYTFTNVTTAANAAISPEGVSNAYEMTDDATSGNHRFIRQITGNTIGQSYTYSIFLKKGTMTDAFLNLFSGGTIASVSVDLENGTISGGVGTSQTIEDYGNDWYRCSITGVAGDTSVYIYLYMNSIAGYSGAGDNMYFYGAQLELGSYPTSYIPTYGSSVTRSVDAMANLDIPDFNDNTSFSVLLELTRNGISSSEIGSMFSFYNDSLTQQFWFHIDAPNAQVRLRDATNSNATMATISFDIDDRKKIAFSCDGSTLKTYADGVLSNTYNLVNVFNVDELRTAAKSFDVHQIVTFPTALTDSECIALTTL